MGFFVKMWFLQQNFHKIIFTALALKSEVLEHALIVVIVNRT